MFHNYAINISVKIPCLGPTVTALELKGSSALSFVSTVLLECSVICSPSTLFTLAFLFNVCKLKVVVVC